MSDIKSTRELLSHLFPGKEISSADLAMLQKKYLSQIEVVLQRAHDAAEAQKQILSEIPELSEIDFNDYKSEVIVIHSHDEYDSLHQKTFKQLISRISIEVTDMEGGIALVEYHEEAYPEQGIKKGFTVGRHNDSSKYDEYDNVYPEKWTNLEEMDPMFTLLTGVALVQNVNRITDIGPSNIPLMLAQMPPSSIQSES